MKCGGVSLSACACACACDVRGRTNLPRARVYTSTAPTARQKQSHDLTKAKCSQSFHRWGDRKEIMSPTLGHTATSKRVVPQFRRERMWAFLQMKDLRLRILPAHILTCAFHLFRRRGERIALEGYLAHGICFPQRFGCVQGKQGIGGKRTTGIRVVKGAPRHASFVHTQLGPSTRVEKTRRHLDIIAFARM